MDSAKLLSLVTAMGSRTVAVIGDIVADEFVYGRVARVSREAPVLILEYDSTEVVPGGGGNAANNVASLGGRANLIGVVGRDEPGRRLSAALHARVRQRGLVRTTARSTPVKTRILAGGIHSAKQQVVRIDRAVGNSFDRDAGPGSRTTRSRPRSLPTQCSSPTTDPGSSPLPSCRRS